VQRARPQFAQVDSRDPFHAPPNPSPRSWTAPDLARKFYGPAQPEPSVAEGLAHRSARPAVAPRGPAAGKSHLEPGGGSVRGVCARGGKNHPGSASSWPRLKVGYGSLADKGVASSDAGLTSQSGHQCVALAGPLRATSRLSHSPAAPPCEGPRHISPCPPGGASASNGSATRLMLPC